MKILALVLSIVGVVFAFIQPIVGIILSIVGLILANIAKKSGKDGMTTAAFVISIIGIILNIIWLIVVLACVGMVGAAIAGLM